MGKHKKSDIEFKTLLISDDIVDLIQNEVTKLRKEHWGYDDCKPKFLISILHDCGIRNKEDSRQYLILNCTHQGRTFGRIIFPRDDSLYGYESLLDGMQDLYNQTI